MTFDPITILAILIAFALGGTLKGATGAGAPIITIPVIAAFYDVRIAVIIMVIPNLLTNISQIYQFRKTILPIFFTFSFALGGGIGAFVGTILLINLPIKISQLVYLRTVSKKWCKIINYIISIYRNIQYKISCQKISKIEKKLLWNHRYEFKNHYTLITKCITANNDKSKEEMEDLINYYKSTKKIYSCRELLCKSACKQHCTSENVLEIGYNTNLSKFKCVEKYLVEILTKKLEDNLLMPWLVELAKKNKQFGMDLAYKCIMDINLFYSFYFETKYYLNSFDRNENLKFMMEKMITLVPKDWLNEIRKTDEFIKFIELLVSKEKIEMCDYSSLVDFSSI